MSINVLIHACPDREWYVNEYMIPSLRAQGIEHIEVWLDSDGRGCLESFAASCEMLGKRAGGTWHLQDDVIISHDFAEQVEKYDRGMVCGFCCQSFSQNTDMDGEVLMVHHWYSFQCIRIPNDYAKEFAEWFSKEARRKRKYDSYFYYKNGDDTLFRDWVTEHKPQDTAFNLKPNIVDHVDFLIGGSVVNKHRAVPSRAAFFDDQNLVDELTTILATRALNAE